MNIQEFQSRSTYSNTNSTNINTDQPPAQQAKRKRNEVSPNQNKSVYGSRKHTPLASPTSSSSAYSPSSDQVEQVHEVATNSLSNSGNINSSEQLKSKFELYTELAQTEGDEGNWSAVITIAQCGLTALSIYPEDTQTKAELSLFIAEAQFKQKNYQSVIQSTQMALDVQPGQDLPTDDILRQLYSYQAHAFLRLRDFSEAASNAEVGLEYCSSPSEDSQRTSSSLFAILAKAKNHLNDFEESALDAQTGLENSENVSNERKGDLYEFLSLSKYALGLFDEAINAAQAGLDLIEPEPKQSTRLNLYTVLASAQNKMENYENALVSANIGLSLNPYPVAENILKMEKAKAQGRLEILEVTTTP